MSNSKLLSNVASNLANSSGKILAVANGKIIWQQNYAWETANIGLLLAQSAYDSANNVAPQVQPAFDQANSAYNLASTASSNTVTLQEINVVQNTNISLAFDQANNAYDLANSAYDSANNVAPQVQPAFDQANTAYELANSAYNRANTTYIPFFKSDGSQENIGLVSGTYLPFYTYTGNSSNILLITG